MRIENKWGIFPEVEPTIRQIWDSDKKDRVRLEEDFIFVRSDGMVLTARAGLIFDGASIPRLFWGVSTNPFAQDVLPAAIIHDEYCAQGRMGTSPLHSNEVHQVFYESLRCIGVSWWRARARWAAVRYFGPHFSRLEGA